MDDSKKPNAPTSDDAASQDISSENQVKGKKGKKQKKPKTPDTPQQKRKTAIISSCVAVVCGVLGCLGGYFLYQYNHPSVTISNRIVDNDSSAFDPTQSQSIKKISDSLKAGNIVTDFKSKPADIINYACYLQSSAKYSLVLGTGTVNAAGVTQELKSATFTTPETVFNENISHSVGGGLISVSTANRYYDDRKSDSGVKAYVCTSTDAWAKTSPTSLSYNSFMESYGKLQKGLYYCTWVSMSDGTEKEKYLTSAAETYSASADTSKHYVNGVLIYIINSSTISESSLASEEGGYVLTATLDPSKADGYYRIQMKTTGGLDSYPVFTSTKLTFHLDSDLGLKSSLFLDEYSGRKVIGFNGSQTLTQYYYRSETSSFAYDGQSIEVTVPEISNTDFSGMQLMPSQD
jgi:hypothetical protein